VGIFLRSKMAKSDEQYCRRWNMNQNSDMILAVDPGKEKCGLAIIEHDRVVLQEVVPRAEIVERIITVLPKAGPIVVGNRTGSREFIAELTSRIPNINNRIVKVDEDYSTMEARALYWQAHPPRGWRKLIPLSLQTPTEPIDDFVAVILARRYLMMVIDGKLSKI